METMNGNSMEGASSGSESGSQSSQTAGAGTQQASGTGVSAETQAGAGNDGGASAQAGGTETQQQAAQAYAPNFKFKVKDKELEFDDFIKPIIKTKDLEAKMREMYEKSHGLDEVKTARDSFKKQFEEWQGKYNQVETSLKTLGDYVKKGDYKSFFHALNIPKDQIIRYAIEELKYQELPADQRAQIDAQREQQLAYEQANSQNQTLQQQMAQLVQQQATFELNQELAKPEVSQSISAYDARAGKPGSFRAEVIRRGQYYEAVHKISPPASQLVSEVLNLVGVQAQQAQQGTQAASQDTSSPTGLQQQKPVISSFSGGGKSPVKKMPSSIDDLRAMRQNLTT